MKMSRCRVFILRAPLVLAVVLVVVALGRARAGGEGEFERTPARQPPAAATPATTATGDETSETYEFEVSAASIWTDTKLELRIGDKIHLTATGSVEFPSGQSAGPQGVTAPGVGGAASTLPLSNSPHGSLIARIGEQDAGLRLFVGTEKQIDVRTSGRLYLGVNEYKPAEAFGKFKVRLKIERHNTNLASRSDETIAALIPPPLLAKIPRVTRTSRKQPRDLVNILMIGSEEDMKLVFQAAGWVIVNRAGSSGAISRDALQSMSEEAYMGRPLSDLYLFGKPQDYGFAHAELVSEVKARHYIRLWLDPSEADGSTLWVGAAAHDTGPWFDESTAEVSYQIDPRVDTERDFVRDILNGTGLVQHFGYLAFGAKGKRSEAGSSLETDGRILVLKLAHL